MDDKIISFIDRLKERVEIQGVIIFGSWARGNNRVDSDVDLMVILKDGFKRTVEHKNGLAFEITYTTLKSVEEYWESHKDDCAGFWEVAKILFDKDGTVKKLNEFASRIIKNGKDPLDKIKIDHLNFDAKDSLEAIKFFAQNDPILANFLLSKKILDLSEWFFDLRQLWVPAPKQKLGRIKEISPELFDLLVRFYKDGVLLNEKINIAEKIILAVFR